MRRRNVKEFFSEAFDRSADPCLEGRIARVMEYLEKRGKGVTHGHTPPWEDVSLRALGPEAEVNDIVGDHLRVFLNECTWRWSIDHKVSYEKAKELRDGDEEFVRSFNADTFEAAMLARGSVRDPFTCRWEVFTEGKWTPYDDNNSNLIERAKELGEPRVVLRLGPRGWSYTIDLRAMVQRNLYNGTERPIRSAGMVRKPGRVSHEELRAGIKFFVDLATLPEGKS